MPTVESEHITLDRTAGIDATGAVISTAPSRVRYINISHHVTNEHPPNIIQITIPDIDSHIITGDSGHGKISMEPLVGNATSYLNNASALSANGSVSVWIPPDVGRHIEGIEFSIKYQAYYELEKRSALLIHLICR